jgi:hypothetical protein
LSGSAHPCAGEYRINGHSGKSDWEAVLASLNGDWDRSVLFNRGAYSTFEENTVEFALIDGENGVVVTSGLNLSERPGA